MKVAILGAGAFGTSVATLLAHNGHKVALWSYESKVADDINNNRVNSFYLPGVTLHESIVANNSVRDVIQDASIIFEAVPVGYLRFVLELCKPFYNQEQTWVVLSKGIEETSLLFPTQIFEAIFGPSVVTAVVSGPSFARDLAEQQLTSCALATTNSLIETKLKNLLNNSYFVVDVTKDVFGVQLCAALKNILALGMGILDGAACADNTRAFFLTKAFSEMAFLAQSLGADHQTIYGLAGFGDLILTSLGKLSRNLAIGKSLGAGRPLGQAVQEMASEPEGISALRGLHVLAERKNLNVPILNGLFQVVFEGKDPVHILNILKDL